MTYCRAIRETDIEDELIRTVERLERNKSFNNKPEQRARIRLRELMVAPVLKPLCISLCIMFFRQATGINAIVCYTVVIFNWSGTTFLDGRYATIILGLVQFVFTVISGFVFVSQSFTYDAFNLHYKTLKGYFTLILVGLFRPKISFDRFEFLHGIVVGGCGDLFPLPEAVGSGRGRPDSRLGTPRFPHDVLRRVFCRLFQHPFHHHGRNVPCSISSPSRYIRWIKGLHVMRFRLLFLTDI